MRWFQIMSGNVESFKKNLIDYEMDLKEPDSDGEFVASAAVNEACRKVNTDEIIPKLKLLDFLKSQNINLELPSDGENWIFKIFPKAKNTLILDYLFTNLDINIKDKDGNSLLNAAIKCNNPAAIEWALNKLRAQVVDMDTQKYNYLVNVINTNHRFFSTLTTLLGEIEEQRIHWMKSKEQSLNVNNPVDKAKILALFDKLGQIGKNEIALIIAARQNKKQQTTNSCFVLSLPDDREKLNTFLQKLILEPSVKNLHQIQFVFMVDKHAVFNEVLINNATTPPKLKFFHCDPALTMIDFGEILKLEELKKIAEIEIYQSSERLQKGLGCTYFSIEGAVMLSKQNNYGNVYDYMVSHGTKVQQDGYVVFQSLLPPRLKRASHLYEDERMLLSMGMGIFSERKDWYDLKGIKSTVLDNPEAADTIINKHNETAAKSIQKDLVTNPENQKVRNNRLDRKRKGYQEKVEQLLSGVKTQGEVDSLINNHSLKGMDDYIMMHSKPSPAAAIKY